MRRFPLRVIPDPYRADDATNVVDYRVVIREVIRRPLDPQRGADIEEMRRGIHILDALDEQSGPILALEDADWEHLRLKVANMQWGVIDKRVLQFIDTVNEATDEAPALNGLVTAKDFVH
jgi:hypothetical protein